mmetsp:Transcript_20976/g.66204  ORF Transcript_20976/g.66204 Transcript_20976/m.66204 type:complete len:222 (+) Transcript_20976:694-1359(+)
MQPPAVCDDFLLQLVLGHPMPDVDEALPEVVHRLPDGLGEDGAGALPHLVVHVEDDGQHHVEQEKHDDQDERPSPRTGVPEVLLRHDVPVVLALHGQPEAGAEGGLQGGEAVEAPAEDEVAADDVGGEGGQEDDEEVEHVRHHRLDRLRHDRQPRLRPEAHEEAEHQDDDVVVEGVPQGGDVVHCLAGHLEHLLYCLHVVAGEVPAVGADLSEHAVNVLRH